MAGLTTLFVVGQDEYVEFNESLGSKAMLKHVWDESITPLTSEETTSTKLHSTGARISPKPPYRIEFPTIRRVKGKGNTYLPTGRWFSWEELARRNPLAVQPPPSIEELRAAAADGAPPSATTIGNASTEGKEEASAEPIAIGSEPRVAPGEWLGADNRIRERQAAVAAIVSASLVVGEDSVVTDNDGWIGKGAGGSIYAPQVIRPAKTQNGSPASIHAAVQNGARQEATPQPSTPSAGAQTKSLESSAAASTSPSTRAKSSQMEAMLLRLRVTRAGLMKHGSHSSSPPQSTSSASTNDLSSPVPTSKSDFDAKAREMSTPSKKSSSKAGPKASAPAGSEATRPLVISGPTELSPGAAALAARMGAIPITTSSEKPSLPARSQSVLPTSFKSPIAASDPERSSSKTPSQTRKSEIRKGKDKVTDDAQPAPPSLSPSTPAPRRPSETHGKATSAFREEFSAATAPIFSQAPRSPPIPTGPKEKERERRPSAGKVKATPNGVAHESSSVPSASTREAAPPSGPRTFKEQKAAAVAAAAASTQPASKAPADAPTGPASMRERAPSSMAVKDRAGLQASKPVETVPTTPTTAKESASTTTNTSAATELKASPQNVTPIEASPKPSDPQMGNVPQTSAKEDLVAPSAVDSSKAPFASPVVEVPKTTSAPAPIVIEGPKTSAAPAAVHPHINWADEDSSSSDDDLFPPEWGLSSSRSVAPAATQNPLTSVPSAVSSNREAQQRSSVPESAAASRWANAPASDANHQDPSVPSGSVKGGKKTTKRGGKGRAKKDAERSDAAPVHPSSHPSSHRQNRPAETASALAAAQQPHKGTPTTPTAAGPLRGWATREYADGPSNLRAGGAPPSGPRADRERHPQAPRHAVPNRGSAQQNSATPSSQTQLPPQANRPPQERRAPVSRPRLVAPAGGAFARLAQGIVVGPPDRRDGNRAGAS